MSTSVPPPSMATNSSYMPPMIFVGSRRVLAAVWYCIVYLISVSLHIAFIMGARKLYGCKANFSFTLLLFLSTLALIYFAAHMIGTIAALLDLDWFKFQLLGSLAYGAVFTVISIDVVIALHRLIYTTWPFLDSNRMCVLATKAIFLAIGVIFILFVIILNTELIGVRWISSAMGFVAMRNRNIILFDIINKVFNYLSGIVNSFAYALLLFILAKKRMLSFAQNHELKVTIQVSIMMAEEVGFFVYWEFFPVQGYGAGMDILIAETALMLFLDVLILPYLILNSLNKISNYLIGVVNLIAYAVLLFTLIKRKMLSFSRSHEIKMTLQVSLMMIAEMIFFCYWEFANVHGYGAWDLVIAEISVLLFFDVLVLPYMILNRSFHAEMKRLFKPCDRKGERVRQLRMSVVTSAT
ncbi:unnamed protein product [Haemonchus placei]|uniref:G_PROTEIN_RECEP_F1_2 domain-containing protein n=1 Tax=Haemonchus placei TaxID=6290 RepID=A0A158QMG4_HAEPC|nr:unnamed protein product [Haemonchus placei]